ncbi:hypothetical protein KEM55_001487 [Ascosphaera atra]|nr:hypothetical protein KEM55_001487 [Ascosphaera atra]
MLRESSPYGYSVTIGAGPAPQPSEGEVPVNETPRTSSRLKKHSNIAKRALSRFSTSLADRDDWPLPSIDKLSAHSSVNISRENEDVLSEQPEPSSPKEAVKPAPASPSAEISMPALSPSFNAFSFDLDNDTFGADRQKDSLGASVAPPDASGESEATVGMVYIARTSTNDNKRDENFKGLACDVSDDNANSMDAPMDPSQAAGTGR